MKKIIVPLFIALTFLLLPLVRAQSIEVISKNLLNPDLLLKSSSDIIAQDRIPLEGGNTYTFSLPLRGQFTYEIYVYDEYENYVQSSETSLDVCNENTSDGYIECTFTLNPASHGVYIDIYSWDLAELFGTTGEYFQIEAGSERTPYVPYEERVIVDMTAPTFQGEAFYITSYQTLTTLDSIITNHITAIDEIDGDVSSSIQVVTDHYTGNETTTGTYQVLLEAMDHSQNKAQFTLNIIVKDEVKPLINGPSTIRTNINDQTSLAVLISDHFTFTDDYDGVIATYTVNTDAYTANKHILGTYQVKLSIEDASGNHQSKTFMIEVFDDEAPIIDGPSSITHPLSSENTLEDYLETFSASDNVDSLLSVTIDGYTMPNLNTVGSYQLTLKTIDTSGNIGIKTVSFVIIDDIAPVLLGVKNHTISYKDTFDLAHFFNTLSVSDNVDALTLSHVIMTSDNYTANKALPGIYQVHYEVSDASGNQTILVVQIEVIDDIAPVFNFSQSIILETSMTLSDDDLYKMILSIDDIQRFKPTSYEVLTPIDYESYQDQFIQIELTNDQGESMIETIKVTMVNPIEREGFNLFMIIIPVISVLTLTTSYIVFKKRF